MGKYFLFFKFFLVFVIFALTFATFIHKDLVHTVIMSTFWNQDLYQVCGGCNYLPLIYGLFYLWGLPFARLANSITAKVDLITVSD
jgi:hypothetical protein